MRSTATDVRSDCAKDNGPEFTSRHFLAWAVERKIEIVYIRPGRPVENAYVESFHGRPREECLNVRWFRNLWDALREVGMLAGRVQ